MLILYLFRIHVVPIPPRPLPPLPPPSAYLPYTEIKSALHGQYNFSGGIIFVETNDKKKEFSSKNFSLDNLTT